MRLPGCIKEFVRSPSDRLIMGIEETHGPITRGLDKVIGVVHDVTSMTRCLVKGSIAAWKDRTNLKS